MNIIPDVGSRNFDAEFEPGELCIEWPAEMLASRAGPLVAYLSSRRPCSPNESLPRSDVFYTLNVLLGMSRLAETPDSISVSEIFRRNVLQLTKLPVPTYAFGMALWAAAELELEIPEEVAQQLSGLLTENREWEMFRAQDLGMLLTGMSLRPSVPGRSKGAESICRPRKPGDVPCGLRDHRPLRRNSGCGRHGMGSARLRAPACALLPQQQDRVD
jgi:hypothetical protein